MTMTSTTTTRGTLPSLTPSLPPSACRISPPVPSVHPSLSLSPSCFLLTSTVPSLPAPPFLEAGPLVAGGGPSSSRDDEEAAEAAAPPPTV